MWRMSRKPFRRQHPDLGPAVREDDVRGDGRPVEEVVDLAERHPCLGAQLLDALDDGARRIVGSGGNLVDRDLSGFLVDEDHVGERAADVDADALHALSSSG